MNACMHDQKNGWMDWLDRVDARCEVVRTESTV